MKVKCISTGWVQDKGILWDLIVLKDRPVKGPKSGDIFTVIGQHYTEGKLYYLLLEWPTDPEEGWDARGFVPLEEKFSEVSFEYLKKEKPISVN